MKLNFLGVSVHIAGGVMEEELIEAEEAYNDVSEGEFITEEEAEKRDQIEEQMYRRGYVPRYDSQNNITIFVPEE